MNDLLNALYGFDELGFGTAGTQFGWSISIQPWLWLMILFIAIAIASLVYSKARISHVRRTIAGSLRAALLIFLFVLAMGPRLEKPQTRIESDRVLYLIDRSASMSVVDASGTSRDTQLRSILADHHEVFGAIASEKDARWYAFGESVVRLNPEDESVPVIPAAGGSTTRLGAAIASIIAENTGHPLSAIVVLSDGRSVDRISTETYAALRAERVPVLTVPLGSADQAMDLAVTAAAAPGIAFVNDTVPVTVSIRSSSPETKVKPALDANEAPQQMGRIEVVDASTGLVLESQALTSLQVATGSVTVPVRMEQTGEQRWTVRYIPDGPDLSTANNETSLAVRFVDDPIRVLYVDGSPRWEHRYLKSLLIREESINASCLLLAADRRFQQEGNTVLSVLPSADEDWDVFDLIIIGDLKADLLGERAIRAIRNQVGRRAGGLLWLAGPSAVPQSWAGSDLADLLPIRTSARTAGPTTWAEPVVFNSTPVSDRLGLFQDLVGTTSSSGVSDASSGWSGLRWALKIRPEQIKPSTSPLAMAEPSESAEQPTPLVLGMRYGAGRTALVATDEIWRWRYGRGEPPTERFWLPLLRHLARPRLAALGSGVSLSTSTQVASVGQQVVVELQLTDRAIAEVAPRSLEATVIPSEDLSATPLTVELLRDAGDDGGPTRFRGAFTPIQPGTFSIRLADPGILAADPSTQIEVITLNDELRSPQTDHDALAEISEATEGRRILPTQMADLAEALPNRRVITPLAPETRTLWDHPAPLGLLIAIAVAEWVLRRRSRLP